MALADLMRGRRRPLDPLDAGPSPIAAGLDGNEAVRRRQRLLLAGGGGVALVASCVWIFGSDRTPKPRSGDEQQEVQVSTTDLVNRNLSNQEWMALSENRFQSAENQLRAVNGQASRVDELAQQVEALRGQNQAMVADGQRVLSAYQQENDGLRQQLNGRQLPAQAPQPGPSAMYGAGAAPLYQRPEAGNDQGTATSPVRASEVRLVSFQPANGSAAPVERGTTTFTDSANYLPPNSIAAAKVVVGVDASAGVNSQADPLPVVLRVTGPARSVYDRGRLLTTRIEGCLVNGAARGDLSSEKVYVRLQKMTCPQPGGRYAVSEVKGFIAFGGKTGVRGRVVSREGSLVAQAFLAGLAGGFGRGFSANTDALLSGPTISTNGERPRLGAGDIVQGGIGNGVAQASDTVSKYLIERAEQYQPVIEMPTGIDVEIVFLEGVYVRN